MEYHVGGGLEIVQRGFDDLNIKVLACHVTNPEPGGWFNKEINSIDDFNGLKMRMAGVGARVLNEFGASAQFLPGSEIYLALERGRIDGAMAGAWDLAGERRQCRFVAAGEHDGVAVAGEELRQRAADAAGGAEYEMHAAAFATAAPVDAAGSAVSRLRGTAS